jgi:hypothetical protein
VVLTVCVYALGQESGGGLGEYFAGQDLHLTGGELTIYSGGELKSTNVLIFENGFSMTVGDNKLASERAVVLIRTLSSDYRDVTHVDYDVRAYLEENVSIKGGKGKLTTDVSETVIDRGAALVAGFQVTGQVFANAESHKTGTAAELTNVELYGKAVATLAPVKSRPTISGDATVPDVDDVVKEFAPQIAKGGTVESPVESPEETTPEMEYPVNIASLWEPAPKIEKTSTKEGDLDVATVTGRFYLWQKRDQKGSLLEFMADSAVVYYRGGQFEFGKSKTVDDTVGAGSVESMYFKGNIVMTEGPRTIRADELFYDFKTRKALAVNAEIRDYDPTRGIPIYVRAAKLRGVSEDVFHANDVTLTTSEFYLPQISTNASEMVLTDTTSIDARTGRKADKSSYDGVLRDIDVKYGTATIFKWPSLRTNFERPDLPIKRAAVGHDSHYGMTLETQWYLARLLGRKEPEGVDSVLEADYFSKRGPGAGFEVEYEQPDYKGEAMAYILQDHGKDDLGRIRGRRDIEPPNEIRGRFGARHRQYLPYDWQLTTELSYLSDRNFLESFYRSEFNAGKPQETLLHLKRLKDNWAFSFLVKPRINDFENMTEELPTVEYHLKGASFWDNMLTFYSDSQLGRMRDRIDGSLHSSADQDFYTFGYTRNEVDLPLTFNTYKVVPYVAGTYAYEDQGGYDTTIGGDTLARGDKDAVLGELGIRASTMFWKEDQYVKSRFWDLNGMRHIVKPHVEAAWYEASDNTLDMRDIYNIGVSQRWQSRRGTAKNLRSFDWMRLDIDATWLEDNEADSIGPVNSYGPASFVWNEPEIPFGVRRNSNLYGVSRDSVNADYAWRVSDTTSILSDMNYDVRSGVVQQFDIGVTRYVYPDMSLYLGNRYLRPVIVTDVNSNVLERGSNSVVAAMTYALSSRYMVTISEEYNFDYGKSVRSEVTIIRRYHRMYYGLTFAADESLNRQSVVFSIWPQGVKELAMGRREYVGLGGRMTTDD